MKIAIAGCGAVGSYYGAQLCRAGQDVHFLLRTDYDVVRWRGVSTLTPTGDFRAQPKCAAQPEEIGPCDLVLIALKTTANDQFSKWLPPLVGPETAILTFQNGLGNEEAVAKLFPAEQVLGGLCFVCLNRIAPGVIRHPDHGLIAIGEFGCHPLQRPRTLAETCHRATVPCQVCDDLARAHWEKLVWNIPFYGPGVAGIAGFGAVLAGQIPKDRPQLKRMCLPTSALLADARRVAWSLNSCARSSPRPRRSAWALRSRWRKSRSHARGAWALTRLRPCWTSSTVCRWSWRACSSNRCAPRNGLECPRRICRRCVAS